MRLYIDNPQALSLDDFIQSDLIPDIQTLLLSNISFSNCQRWSQYFRHRRIGGVQYNKKVVYPSAYDVIINGINSITYTKQGDNYVIQLDQYKKAPRSTAKLIDLCHLVNYGNLEMGPYSLFSDVFRDVDRNLQQFYNSYKNKGVF